jgi:uncharacterized protein YjbI with pentapeptide repeats
MLPSDGMRGRTCDRSRPEIRQSIINQPRAHLNGANLSETDLVEVNLSGAYLNGATLSYATLVKTDLTGADLTGPARPSIVNGLPHGAEREGHGVPVPVCTYGRALSNASNVVPLRAGVA